MKLPLRCMLVIGAELAAILAITIIRGAAYEGEWEIATLKPLEAGFLTRPFAAHRVMH